MLHWKTGAGALGESCKNNPMQSSRNRLVIAAARPTAQSRSASEPRRSQTNFLLSETDLDANGPVVLSATGTAVASPAGKSEYDLYGLPACVIIIKIKSIWPIGCVTHVRLGHGKGTREMRVESETLENAEAPRDDERGLGDEPVAATEGAAPKPLDEPGHQPSNLATLEGPGFPVEAVATAERERPRIDATPDFGLLIHQVTYSVRRGSEENRNWRLMDGAVGLYQSLEPQDPTESIIARLIVASTNATMDSLGRAAQCDDLSRARDLNLRYGLKAAPVVADLIKLLASYRGQSQGRQTVTVREVNVEAGGQAIVGNVEVGDRRNKPAQALMAPGKGETK